MTRQTKLHGRHRASGAVFTDLPGWGMPLRFSSFSEEYGVLKDSAGLLDFSDDTILEVSGRDHVRFLHGMLTNDIKALLPGKGCYAAMLTPQGRIVADMQVYREEESIILLSSPVLRDKLPQALKKYIIADQVDVKDVSDLWGVLSIQGPKASNGLSQITSASLPQSPFDHAITEVLGAQVRFFRRSRIPPGGYDLMVSKEKLTESWDLLLKSGEFYGLRPVGWEAFNAMRVESGVPLYGLDLDESHLPLEAGLQSAISLTKGCYMGQEIVARATYRGQLNWKLSGLLLPETDPLPKGCKILKDGKEVGQVTSSVFSPTLGRAIAMSFLRREVLEPGTLLQAMQDEGSVECEVAAIPFVHL